MDYRMQQLLIENVIGVLDSQTGTVRDLASQTDSEALEYASAQIDTALYLLHRALIDLKLVTQKEG